MQKINIISCCAECSSFNERTGVIPYCTKKDRRLDTSTASSINPALIGFPDWCPLEYVEKSGKNINNYKKEVKQILQIMRKNTPDSLAEASYYLNTIVNNNTKSN